jgi:hypothetical protein
MSRVKSKAGPRPKSREPDVVDGIERDYENAKAVAKAMAERDPEVRLH